MPILNDLLYNHAVIGAVAGLLDGRPVTSSTAADYATAVNAAEAFALQLDSIIPEDATISTGGGDASQLALSSSANAYNALAKSSLIRELSRSQFSGRFSSSAVQADYSAEAAAVKAAYTQALTKLTNAA